MGSWGEETKVPFSGITLKDGERVGMLFQSGKTLYATYSEKDDSFTWEDDGTKVKSHEDYLWAIRRWLEK